MILPRDIRIVNKLAKLCASNTVELRCKHVAALADKNNIISLGMNKTKTDSSFFEWSQNQKKLYIHAESDCLKGMARNLKRYSLYVVRVDRNKQLAQSKPCPICSDIINWHGVGRVVYTIENGIKEIRY